MISRNKREGKFIGRVKYRQWINGAWTPWEFKRRQGQTVLKNHLPLSDFKKAYRNFNRIYGTKLPLKRPSK